MEGSAHVVEARARGAKFFVPGLAETKGSWRAIGAGKVKRDNPREKAWATAVGWAAKLSARGLPPTKRRVGVEILFVLPAPEGKKHRRDIDKLARSCLDAMTGILCVDDEQVDSLHVDKRVAAPNEPIGCHVLAFELAAGG